jgi:hypothetical protein
VTVRCDVPAGLSGRGVFPPSAARGFEIVLDQAQPWGGGVLAGRVERRGARDARPVTLVVRTMVAWIDIAPQLVGQKLDSHWLSIIGDVRGRRRPIWLDDIQWEHRVELGPLDEVNWQSFHVQLPPWLPRAFEGTFCGYRYQLEARRPRGVGSAVAGLPLFSLEPRTEPCVRIERTPIGLWRLREWRGDHEDAFDTPSVSVAFEPRRLGDQPLPGEDREAEILRRTGRVASPT